MITRAIQIDYTKLPLTFSIVLNDLTRTFTMIEIEKETEDVEGEKDIYIAEVDNYSYEVIKDFVKIVPNVKLFSVVDDSNAGFLFPLDNTGVGVVNKNTLVNQDVILLACKKEVVDG